MTRIYSTLLILCFVLSKALKALAVCTGSLNLSSLVHELVVDTESSCWFEVYPPSEANTTLLFVEQIRGSSGTISPSRAFQNRTCYLRYIQGNFSSCVNLNSSSPLITVPINGSFHLELHRSWYPLNLTFVVNSYQGPAPCEGDLNIGADSSMEFTVTRTTGCQDYCVLNVTAQRSLAIICPSPFCHYILYSYAAGQLMRPALDNIYPLNGTKANLLLYILSNSRMRIAVEARTPPPGPTTRAPSTTTTGSTRPSVPTTSTTTTTLAPLPTTTSVPSSSTSTVSSTQTTSTRLPTTTSTRPTTTDSSIRTTTDGSGGNGGGGDCPRGFFRRVGCFFQKLWEKLKAFIDSYNVRRFRRM